MEKDNLEMLLGVGSIGLGFWLSKVMPCSDNQGIDFLRMTYLYALAMMPTVIYLENIKPYLE